MHFPTGNLDRRTFLIAGGMGLLGAGGASGGTLPPRGKARSTILFFLCGGASHIDTWDMKPDAPAEYRGPFRPVPTSAAGVKLCEHLPLLGRQAHHLAVINSISGKVNTNDHHAGYYHNLTGHVPDQSFRTLGNNRTPFPDDWPFMGSVVAAKVPSPPNLPPAITLPYKPSRAPYTRPGQFAARLGVEYDPLYVMGDLDKPLDFRAPALALSGDVSADRLQGRKAMLGALDEARREGEASALAGTWDRQRERAFSLLLSSRTAGAFEVSREPARVRARYGETVNGTSLLLARRLVEAGVPFVTVFWKVDPKRAKLCRSGGGWDTHGNNFNCLKDLLLPEFDQSFSALLEDLATRGLLDSTLVMVTSEMGRKPKIGDPRSGGVKGAGRDHWTYCLTDLLAGGGIRGGQVYGSSDPRAEYPADKPVTPAHVARTVFHAMGITDLMAKDRQGRPFHLLDEGEPLTELF